MESNEIKNNHKHDNFFKKAIAIPKVAEEFFETYLPAHILGRVDLKTLNQQNETFLDVLGSGSVDALFEVEIDKEAGYFYALVEQQTKPDPWMPFRILRYMIKIYDCHLKKYPESNYLPIVYPIVFFTGEQNYTTQLDLWKLFKDPKLAKSIFFDPFQLIQLHSIEDDELRKKTWLGVMSLMMKYIKLPDILPFLEEMMPLLKEIAGANFIYMEAVLCYTLEQADSPTGKKVVEFFKEIVPEQERGNIMTIADRLREEAFQLGEQRGIQLGEQRGMQQGMKTVATNMLTVGQSVEFIAKVTGLTVEEVKKLKSSIIH